MRSKDLLKPWKVYPKYWMQILKGLYTVKIIEGDVDDFIEHISDWERYIRLHCK